MTQAVVAIHQAKGFTVQVPLVPSKDFSCVLQLIVSFALLGFLLQMASLQEPFLFFIFDFQVYVDDFGGVEKTKEKALESFHSLGNLLVELGLEEGVDKAQGDKGTLAKLGLARDVQNANRLGLNYILA